MKSTIRLGLAAVLLLGISGSALMARPVKPLRVQGVYELQTKDSKRDALILVDAVEDGYRVWGVVSSPGSGPRSYESSGIDFTGKLRESKLSPSTDGGKQRGPELRFTRGGLVVRDLADAGPDHVGFAGSYLRMDDFQPPASRSQLLELQGDYYRSSNRFQAGYLNLHVLEGQRVKVVVQATSLSSESDDSPKVNTWEGEATVSGPLIVLTEGPSLTAAGRPGGFKLEILSYGGNPWVRELDYSSGSDLHDEQVLVLGQGVLTEPVTAQGGDAHALYWESPRQSTAPRCSHRA
ncbi:MAG TPA: hypothetical protein VGS07_14385 [Thermoanaerobaculia bacterium]|jgi:hypothetical protein|nr:hypothetical protein [Thermoanaerobaculia bacterium]